MSLVRDVSTFFWLLLAYCFARYAVVPWDMPSLDMHHIIYSSKLISTDGTVTRFVITTKDAFILAGVVLLFVEIYKAATLGEYSMVETIVSFMVAVAYLTIFLLWNKAHTIEMFILMVMAFIDAIGGFVISLNAARKDIKVG